MSDSPLIFVVDDDELVSDMLRVVLEDGGYEVETAGSADEALARLDNTPGAFRVLVTDVNLGKGELTGWDVARRAREISPDLPVVYMSGFADNDWTANGVPYSVMLTKPFTPSQLVTAIGSLLTRGLTH